MKEKGGPKHGRKKKETRYEKKDKEKKWVGEERE